jgi:cytochrome c oxidase subunit 3
MMSGSHGVIFYWLTGLHGAHVVGGVVFLTVCLTRAARGRYSASSHLGVELCELYWHFLGIVWVVLVTTLFLVL